MMKIQLIDKNKEMCDQWLQYFDGCEDVTVHCDDFFSLQTDCIVSPANSFGIMNGGLDLVISNKLGWHIQEKLQKQIMDKYNGELLVGQAELIETENNDILYCISAPTMRIPLKISNTVNVYLATKAIFCLLKANPQIKSISISGLGTGVGDVPYGLCAYQMRMAYNDFWLNKYIYPKTIYDASKKHYELLT